jgi:hypothetical protein
MTTRWIHLLCAAGLLAAAAQAAAQAPRPTYKCTDAKGKAVYSQTPCPDAKVIGEKKPKTDPRKDTPPQDRARAANRAKLSPEELQKCDNLAATIKEQEATFNAKPKPTVPEDERPLTLSRKEYRELRCA